MNTDLIRFAISQAVLVEYDANFSNEFKDPWALMLKRGC